MMNRREIAAYLENTPKRYDNATYLSFLQKVGIPSLPPAIHITGTNGKGSSARYIALTLQKSGYKVGLFTSPHYLRVNELATIDGVEISDAFISAQIKKYDKDFKHFKLSYFEIMTFISFLFFADAKLDYAIIEVGMGGRLDSTNIFTPILSIITNVGADHINEIGPTLKDIARHKAGIIKDNIPVLVGESPSVAIEEIEKEARLHHAIIHTFNYKFEIISKSLTNIKFLYEGETYLLGSGASYEVNNAVLVINAIRLLKEIGIVFKKGALEEAFLEETYPGRFSVVSLNPPIVVDGAHNPHAIRAIMNDLKATKHKLVVVFAAFKDKDYEREIDLLALASNKIILTTFPHPRANTDYFNSLPYFSDHQVAITHAIKRLKPKELLLIVGSLYFASLVTREFQGGVYASHE